MNEERDYKEPINDLKPQNEKGKYSSVIFNANNDEESHYYSDMFLNDKDIADELLKKYEKYDDHGLLARAVELDIQGKIDSYTVGENYGGEMDTHREIYELLVTYLLRTEHPLVEEKRKGYAELADAYENTEVFKRRY